MNRRDFVRSAGLLAGTAWLAGKHPGSAFANASTPKQFNLAVISDGLSADFETALKIVQSYNVKWVELRSVWGKYNTEATPEQIRQLKDLLVQYDIRCSQVDTALFKCTLPGTTPLGSGKPVYPYEEQMELLKRAMDRAHAWGTDKIRVFAFWRVPEPGKIFTQVSDELHKAAEIAKSGGMRLTIENEDSTNVGTVHELSAMLATLPANVGANYDIGNGLWLGEVPYPDGYRALDPQRIWNMHVKGAQCGANFKDCQEAFTDQGQIDLKGQLQALIRDGFRGTMALECEYQAPGLDHTATTRRSLEGLLKVMAEAAT